MDKYGNPIPGPSRDFNNDYTKQNIQILMSEDQNIIHNKDSVLKLLERCNICIDIVSRKIVYLEEMMSEIKSNIDISKRNATKAHKCIEFENKSISKVSTLRLKNKAHLTNFFKLGLSNCPQNPHLTELYDTGRLILSYNGRFILEECIERNLWAQEFKNKLEEAIHIEVLDKIKNPLIEQHVRLSVDQTLQNDPTIKNKIELEMFGIQKKLDTVSKTPFKHLVLQFMDSDLEYDWLHIAKLTNKPDLLCKRIWHLILKPHISRVKWTKSEEDKLIEIVKYYKERNWQQIATKLDTNRNELQCFIHYLKFFKTFNKRGKWSKQEDQKLSEIVTKNSCHNIINWARVYIDMLDEGRCNDQIYNRWMWCLRPGYKKGFLDETEKFIIAVAQKQNIPPATVSKNLINRTSAQIRNAYRRISFNKEDTIRGPWTPEEDEILLHAVHACAPNELTWRRVSEKVPGRNPESCRHRFQKIKKTLQKNPNTTINDFPRSKQTIKQPFTISEHHELLNEYDLNKNFEEHHKLQTTSSVRIESVADRNLKKAFIDNIYITNHCNFSSKCDLLKYILNYLNADLIVPQEFVHKDDLINEGLMSMMSYLKEFSNDVLTLHPNKVEENESDMKFIHENPHDVLTTSDIINSDFSEINGLLDIRMRNFEHQSSNIINTKNSKNNNSENSVSLKIKNIHKTPPIPLNLSSVPPNYETIRFLYNFSNVETPCEINKNSKVSNIIFDWDNNESKKLHQRLVAILRWPALISGMIKYDSAKINMTVNTEVAKNLNHPKCYSSKKKKPSF